MQQASIFELKPLYFVISLPPYFLTSLHLYFITSFFLPLFSFFNFDRILVDGPMIG